MSGRLRIPPRKQAAKAAELTLINGLTKEEITREQLEEHIARLRAELHREEMERDYYQLESTKMEAFRDVAKKQLEKLKAEEKKLEEEIEEDERRHQENIKGYVEEIKHLLREHQKTISELKAEALHATEVLQKEQEKLENELHKETRAIEVDMQELETEDLVNKLQQAHDEAMAEARGRWEKQLAEIKAAYQKKEELLSLRADVMKTQFFDSREEQKNSHLKAGAVGKANSLTEAKALIDMMKQDIQRFESLKSQLVDMKKQERKKRKDLGSLLDENKRLAERLNKAKKEYAAMEERMEFYQAKMVVDNTKKKELNKMKREYQALQQKFSKLQLEKDECEKDFIPTIQRAQQRAADRKMKLDMKLKGLIDRVERTQAQLDSLLSMPPADQTALNDLIKKAEELLESRNNSIKKLRSEKAQLSQAHKDLLFACQMKRRSRGLPTKKS